MFSYTINVNALKAPVGKIMGFATLIIDETLEVHGFRIINGSKGLFVSPPQHKGKWKNPETKQEEEKWYNDVNFVGDSYEAARDEVYGAIITEYEKAKGSSSKGEAASAQQAENAKSKPLW